MIGRRAILKAIGIGPAAIVASAADHSGQIEKMMGAGVWKGLDDDYPTLPSGGAQEGVQSAKALAYLATNQIPAFAMERIRREAHHLHRMDADLIANRSYSLVAKRRLQIEREVERALAAVRESPARNVLRGEFAKKFGFELY